MTGVGDPRLPLTSRKPFYGKKQRNDTEKENASSNVHVIKKARAVVITPSTRFQ